MSLVRLEPDCRLPTTPYPGHGPRPALAIPTDSARALRYGVDLWNQRCFWEAHEVWEGLWRVAGPERRRLLQGLIQAAAAHHATALGREAAAARIAVRARAHLAPPYPDDALGRLAAQLADPDTAPLADPDAAPLTL